jgi:hypothetical protein
MSKCSKRCGIKRAFARQSEAESREANGSKRDSQSNGRDNLFCGTSGLSRRGR